MTQQYCTSDYEKFVGIDVDKKKFVFSVESTFLKPKGPERSKSVPSDPEKLLNYINNKYPGEKVLCGYEAGPTGYELHDYLNDHNIMCVVINPLSLPKAGNERVKTNKIDAKKIAHSLQTKSCTPIRVPEGMYRELRMLIRLRFNYSEQRKKTKQRIKSYLLLTGKYKKIEETRTPWSKKYINQIKDLECTLVERTTLDNLLGDLEYSRSKLLYVHKQLKNFCTQEPEIEEYRKLLQSIPGIGFLTALTVLGKIGNPRYLQNQRELGSFMGLVPNEKSTGEEVKRGRITRLGDRRLRFILVEAAWIAIQRDVRLKQVYDRIRHNHPPRIGARKAIIAVARKLTLIIYRVLKDRREYISY